MSLGKLSDKFEAVDPGICARACAATEECSHWSYGQQYGTKKCFLRKSDEGYVFYLKKTKGGVFVGFKTDFNQPF